MTKTPVAKEMQTINQTFYRDSTPVASNENARLSNS